MSFAKQGVTMSGAPYFKAQGREAYLYWDPDCEGGTANPVARWVFDDQKPSLNKQDDLDGDHACNVIARIDSLNKIAPPSTGTWTMYCDSIEEQHFLTLREAYPQPTAYAPSTLVRGGQRLIWNGACQTKSFVNGLIFEEVGATADGRPFFKAQAQEIYIYFDADCDGVGTTLASRWVLDNGRPSTVAPRDLDQDGKCDYHARLDSVSQRPPAAANWRMYCGYDGFVDVPVTLSEQKAKAVNSAHTGGSFVAVAALVTAGVVALGF